MSNPVEDAAAIAADWEGCRLHTANKPIMDTDEQLLFGMLAASLKLSAQDWVHASIDERGHYEKKLAEAAAAFGKFCHKHQLYEPTVTCNEN